MNAPTFACGGLYDMTRATKSVIHSLRIFFIAESRSEIRYF